MKKTLLILTCFTAICFADTNSVDITISDLKEAIYRLIIDVNKLKATNSAPAHKLDALIRELEEKQKNVVFLKGNDDANDVLIREFVSKNQALLMVK